MSATQNTLIDVARLSMRLPGRYMQPYSHAKSPKKFTQSQLMTCLILQTYLKTTYRGAGGFEKVAGMPWIEAFTALFDAEILCRSQRHVGDCGCDVGKYRWPGR